MSKKKPSHTHQYAQRLSVIETAQNTGPISSDAATTGQCESWQGWREFKITDKRFENPTEDICSFYLEPNDGQPIPNFYPGQFLTFRLDQVTQSYKPLIRCYSISHYTQDHCYRVSIRRALPPPNKPKAPSGVASTHFHDVLHVGAVVSCKAPSGEFYMPLDHPPRKPIVLIASGVGITPSMSILDAYMHHFVQEEKKNNSKVLPIYLFYGERTVDQLAFKGHLDRLKAHPCVHIHYCISSPNPGEHAGVDFDHQGYVSVELMSNIVGTLDCDFYMCGSEKVMNSLKDQFSKRGVPPEQVHYEVLIPKTGVKKVDKDAPKYHIECSESDEEIIWQGGHECLLDLLKDEEIDVDYGCGQGKCGACATPVLEGEFKYTKKPTTSVQAGHCLPCICQPITDLKLDL